MRERERQTETDRHIDRQTDRQTIVTACAQITIIRMNARYRMFYVYVMAPSSIHHSQI